MQFIADLLNLEVRVAAAREATAMGIANLAAHSALGISLKTLSDCWQSEAVYQPQIDEEERHDVWQNGTRLWKQSKCIQVHRETSRPVNTLYLYTCFLSTFTNSTMNTNYDIAIIGAGAVGSAIARELSRYDINVVLLEANSDVGMGTSKASTAIWHTGYDATPGTLEAALLKRSYPLMAEFMKEVGSPFELVGGLLIAWNAGTVTYPAQTAGEGAQKWGHGCADHQPG